MFPDFQKQKPHVAVVGLGYVGLPLALGLAKHMPVTGFDISARRVQELKRGEDSNRETDAAELRATSCRFTSDENDIGDCSVFIVTVPTPIDAHNEPDLTAVRQATAQVGRHLKKGDIYVLESTVYPGVTEDVCGKILEDVSGLKCGVDFFLGYSPERINPGDTEHTVETITKVVSGQTSVVTEFLAAIYGSVNRGNVFKATNIKVAEASKAIENAQRDINVAFINEITMVLNKLGLCSHDVLDAARTKWNFLPFTPGLVGGHCIGVDPYYLARCAQNLGHEPEVILSGRRINDGMGAYVAERIDRIWNERTSPAGPRARVLLLGFTFKENINDIRNTKVVDIIARLKALGHTVVVHDPHADPHMVAEEYGVELLTTLAAAGPFDCLALVVAHEIYAKMSDQTFADLLGGKGGIIYDLKGLWRRRSFGPEFAYQCI
ncbi:MAG: nucleotide sugar dehydrogenase [Alphaproteobacteria bacterium]|nr:nucleotide sugar dehydrogenase [Alphaproteobacteria bacterium]